jgi:hypothetical protein
MGDSLSCASSDNLLKMMMFDFTAVLLAYNLPRDEARQVASQVIESVREHCVHTGTVLRRARL